MPIRSVNYTTVAKVVNHINNPNRQTGTLLEEIPADIGRSYQGYKRGGLIEGAEKLRKEVFSAGVWLFGIPIFNFLGAKLFEIFKKIPMNMDYSEDTIKNVINYLKTGSNPLNKNACDLKKYLNNSKLMENIKNKSLDVLVNETKKAKQITSLSAIVLNCAAMGIIIPKINQAITRKKLKQNTTTLKPTSIEEYKSKTKNKNNQISFSGKISNLIEEATYRTENDNKFRLIITDIPMIIGRMAVSRNPYEALETLVIDGGSIYFYNFIAGHIQKLLSKPMNTSLINPIVAETIAGDKTGIVEKTLKNLPNEPKNLDELFKNKEFADLIYNQATYQKYLKINKFVPDEDIKQINESVFKYLKKLNELSKKENINDFSDILKIAQKMNKKNAFGLTLGLIASVFGLGVFLPKLAFWITEKLTGRKGFIAIQDFNKKNKNSNS